ncbi:WD repeat-containing protein 19-like [Oppia nitens]|uniref:WD repeat-containing protein 19-like n=1 Tax=Oppia nitens TaxID=1686743 RepID=UPI0023DBDBB4|nr:WD repeat-containing protein 19-like [Oppia nitens]
MKRIFSIGNASHSVGSVFFTWQKGTASYLVTTGLDSYVNIYDRHGERVDQINLPGYCNGVAWDSDGDLLGIITDRSPCVILWDANTHRVQMIDTGVRDVLSLIIWAKLSSPLLAVGTSKGNLLIYNHRTARKIPILGKHTKKIISGAWSDNNLLALVGEDRVLTVSNEEGDNIAISSLKGDGLTVQFAFMRLDDKTQNTQQNCVSLILNKRQLFLLNLSDSENPIQLSFQERYGLIVDYQWYGEGLILIGFTSGIFVVVSANYKELGQELNQFRAHKESLTTFNVCLNTKRLVSCSENNVKVCDLNDLNDVQSVMTIDDEPAIEWMEWSDDGQLLAMVSPSGTIHVYLSKLTILGDSFGTRLAFLSSLLEVTVFSVQEDLSDSVIITRVDVEPSLVAVGPYHVAVAMNNRVWFYNLTVNESTELLREREYVGIVKCLKINGDYAAALFTNGTIHLHLIENELNPNDYDSRDLKAFPDSAGSSIGNGKITTLCLTNDFLIYATDSGSIEMFMLEDWVMVCVYRHTIGIKMISSNVSGIRIAVVDDRNDAFIYNAVTDVMIQLSQNDFPTNPKFILWESWPLDKGVFIACDIKFAYVFIYIRDTIEGPAVEYAGKMKIPSGQFPLLLYNGVVVCQTQSGKTSNFVLSTHDFGDKMTEKSRLKCELLVNILKLRRYQDAWKICEYLNDVEAWDMLGKLAINDMDLDLAIKIYRHIQDSGFVNTLEKLKAIEERNLLAAHLANCCDRHDLAQTLFLISSQPLEALEMRKSLLQWSEALTLAKRLAPKQMTIISREYAVQLEFTGDYNSALDNYEKGLINSDTNKDTIDNIDNKTHNELCMAGIARNSIRLGNTRRGIDFLNKLTPNPTLLEECATILDSMKLYSDAALLFEKSGNPEKAANLYMKVKNFNKVSDLLEKVDNKEIQSQYAKAKEMEGKFREAVKAYIKAEEWLSVVRIYLDHLNNPGEAVKIVRETKSIDGAKMIAKFFQRINDMSSAIEFLIMSKCHEEAYQLAQSTQQMDIYANILLNYTDDPELTQDFLSIAIHYEQERDALRAGKFYCIAGQYKKGVKFLLQAAAQSNDGQNQAVHLVIEAAAKSRDEQIIRIIIDYLIGETDGVPKDFKYLFRLYMSLEYYKEAAKTALIIAGEEQNAGNYRNAHDLLFGMFQELKRHQIAVPSEMTNSLMLIHSYILIKIWIRVGDHMRSAKLLTRVANNLSRFPQHMVPILTSAVIECQRSGLKRESLEFATTLMKSEYRDQIDVKFKKKIETLVRKSAALLKTQDSEDSHIQHSLCPYCDNEVIDMELTCHKCRNTIPFCIATGLNIVRDELTVCPNCHFPAILSQFIRLLSTEPICPMCNTSIDLSQVVPLHDIQLLLDSHQLK